jgi:hypothetical protein
MDDLTDTPLIAQMLAATARWEAATGRRMLQKPLRDAIWSSGSTRDCRDR